MVLPMMGGCVEVEESRRGIPFIELEEHGLLVCDGPLEQR
jgi:hypothetical protein